MLNLFRRSAVATLLSFLALAVAAGASGAATTAHAAGFAPAPATGSSARGYELEGFRWDDRTQIDIYYNWDGGTCVLDGTDLSGPASALDPAVALAMLDASIADINTQMRGGLTLVNRGPTTRADLCTTTSGHAIVIGYGTISSTGLTLFSGITAPGAEYTSFTDARVFLDNTYDFTCGGESPFRDLQHVISHELLHALGIDHSADPTAIMAAVGNACELQSALQADDVAALAVLYPPVIQEAAPTTTTATETGTAAFDRPITSAGVNTALWGGGSTVELGSAALASGGISVTTFSGGQAVVYIPGAPSFVNASFVAVFPGGVPAGTIVLIVR